MGLDMYLSRRHYVGNMHRPKGKRVRVQIPKDQTGVFFPVEQGSIKTERISYIEEEVIYWRKANAIHKWFVDNVQNGVDDCGNYYVSREQLNKLLDICEQVLEASVLEKGLVVESYTFERDASTGEAIKKPTLVEGEVIRDPTKAQELLPTQEGFFFGSTQYDTWYFSDIQRTVEVLREILKEPDHGEYYYHSSW